MRKAEVEEVCRRITDSAPGTTKYLGGYQKALSEVLEGLTKEEEAEYRAMAKTWTKKSPPLEIQRR